MMYSSGTFKSIKTYNFTYAANKEGVYKFDNIKVKVNNRTYISDPVQIEVTDYPIRNRNDNYTPSGNRFDDFLNYADDIYVDNNINKKEVYLYEPVYITQKAYTHIPVSVLGFSKIQDRTDFISYSDSSEYNSFTEIIDGKRLNVISLKKEVLYPVKIGVKTILTTPFIFEKNGTIYDRVQYGEERIEINVLPLPDKKGFDNFSGGVGNFVFNVKSDKTNVSVGENVLITIEVFGEGNTSVITMPEINNDIINYFSVYQPKIYETNWFDDNKIISKKIKEYILVAKNEGSASISNINFCYFSVNDRAYTNIYSASINLKVLGNKIDADSFADNNGDVINAVSIRNNLSENKNFKILSINIIYFYIALLIIVSLLIYNAEKINNIKLLFSSKNDKDNNFKSILQLYNLNDRKEYCKSVENILLTAVKNKFNLKDDNALYERLSGYIDNEKTEKIKDIINKCNFELYSGKSFENEDYHTDAFELVKYIKELKIKK